MNTWQRVALWIGGVVILILALFPPWRLESYAVIRQAPDAATPCDFRAGHSFLFHPPDHVEAQATVGDARIDLPQLLAEWVIVAALTFLVASLLRDARPSQRLGQQENIAGGTS